MNKRIIIVVIIVTLITVGSVSLFYFLNKDSDYVHATVSGNDFISANAIELSLDKNKNRYVCGRDFPPGVYYIYSKAGTGKFALYYNEEVETPIFSYECGHTGNEVSMNDLSNQFSIDIMEEWSIGLTNDLYIDLLSHQLEEGNPSPRLLHAPIPPEYNSDGTPVEYIGNHCYMYNGEICRLASEEFESQVPIKYNEDGSINKEIYVGDALTRIDGETPTGMTVSANGELVTIESFNDFVNDTNYDISKKELVEVDYSKFINEHSY